MSTSAPSIGLVGCGIWGRNILRDLLALGCSVHVAEPDQASGDSARARGATSVCPRIDALPHVDGFVVATPASTHLSVVEALPDASIPVFLEKPFATDIASGERMAAMYPQGLFVMHVWRYHPGVEALRELARSQAFGTVLGLRTVRTNWTSPRQDVDSIWTLAPHDLSIALEILGMLPKPRFAIAEQHEGQAVGLIATCGSEPWHVLEVSTRYGDKRRETRLHTTAGVAVLPSSGTHVDVYHGDARSLSPDVERWPLAPEAALFRELRTFVEFLKGGPEPKSSINDALMILRHMLQLRDLAGLTP